MARMHSRKKGKSGSNHPVKKVAPDWVQYTKDEIKDVIIKKFKEGKSMSMIGVILRDQYGIPSVKVVLGKTIKQVLQEENLLPKWPEDLMNLMKKAVRLRKHLEENKMDKHNRRALQLTESKIRRLVKYYKSRNVIDKKWYYKPEEAALLIKE